MWWAWTVGTGWADELHVGTSQPYHTLGEALAVAVSGDRILVDPGRYAEDTDIIGVVGIEIVGAGSDPTTGTVFEGGDGAAQWHLERATIVIRDLAIDGQNGRRVLTMMDGSDLDAWNVRFSHGSQPSGAGISVIGSTLSLHGSVVDANTSTGPGGGLYATDAVVLAEDCVFSANTSAAEGGGIWIGAGAELDLLRSAVVDGSARSGGGLACASALRCTVDATTFERNVASDGGGGIHLFLTTNATVLRSSFCDNIAGAASGGGVTVFESSATFRNCALLDNRSGTNGGGLLVHASVLNLENNTLLGDGAGGRGGALYQDGESATRSVNNLVVDSSSDDSPFAAVDVYAGSRNGGYDLYFDNVADEVPTALPNDLFGVDPLLTVSGACEAPRPANPGPTIDAGDPQVLDPDGSRSDLGATGGPDALRDQDGDGTFDGEDCNDGDAGQNPGRPEACNGVDDDCDEVIDEDCAIVDPTDPRGAEPLDEAGSATGCGCSSTGGVGPSVLVLMITGCRRRRRRCSRR